MLHHVVNLDTGKGWYFKARTPYEAMTALRYWLACRWTRRTVADQ